MMQFSSVFRITLLLLLVQPMFAFAQSSLILCPNTDTVSYETDTVDGIARHGWTLGSGVWVFSAWAQGPGQVVVTIASKPRPDDPWTVLGSTNPTLSFTTPPVNLPDTTIIGIKVECDSLCGPATMQVSCR